MRCAQVATTADSTAAPASAAWLDPYRPVGTPAPATEFSAELLWVTPRVAVVALRGELDAYTAPRFRALAATALRRGATALVVDLGEAEFIDAAGLGVTADLARSLGAGAVAVIAGRSMQRLVRIVGLDSVLSLCATREQALHAVVAA